MIGSDYTHPAWTLLFDSAYVCEDDSKTPGLRKIALRKGTLSINERNNRRELSRISVVVEQFFGRLKSLWSLFRKPYRHLHEKLDMDFDMCVLLTNEHIKVNLLQNSDQLFYRNLETMTKLEQEKKRKRNQEQVKASRTRKRQRLSF